MTILCVVYTQTVLLLLFNRINGDRVGLTTSTYWEAQIASDSFARVNIRAIYSFFTFTSNSVTFHTGQ